MSFLTLTARPLARKWRLAVFANRSIWTACSWVYLRCIRICGGCLHRPSYCVVWPMSQPTLIWLPTRWFTCRYWDSGVWSFSDFLFDRRISCQFFEAMSSIERSMSTNDTPLQWTLWVNSVVGRRCCWLFFFAHHDATQVQSVDLTDGDVGAHFQLCCISSV